MKKTDKADLMFRFLTVAKPLIGTTVEETKSTLKSVFDPDDGWDTYGRVWTEKRPITAEEIFMAGNKAIYEAYRNAEWAVDEWYRYVYRGTKHNFKMSPPEGWEESDFESIDSLRKWAEYHADSFHTTWEERGNGEKRYQAMLKKVFA